MSSAHALKPAGVAKLQATCANKLIPRLARYFGNETAYGKYQVRKLLVAGGYKGPRWSDEARAIKILTAAGRDLSKFEHAQPTRTTNGYAVAAKSYAPPAPTVTGLEHQGPSDKLKNVTIILLQSERRVIREIKEGKRRTLEGLAPIVNALDEIGR